MSRDVMMSYMFNVLLNENCIMLKWGGTVRFRCWTQMYVSKPSHKPDMWSCLSKKEASTLTMLNRKLIIEKRLWNLEPKAHTDVVAQ